MSAALLAGVTFSYRGQQRLSPDLLSAMCGLAWGVLGFLLVPALAGRASVGGLLAGPLIGFAIGRLTRPFGDDPLWSQALISLISLYVSAALFGMALGIFIDASAPSSRASNASLGLTLAVLWGLTFMGYWIVLWPLSYVTHRLVWSAARADETGANLPSPDVDISADAVARLGARVMVLALVVQGLYLVLVAFDAPRSPAPGVPWWVEIGMMGWTPWLVLGGLTWLAAPALAAGASLAGRTGSLASTYSALAGVAGFALLAYPVLSFVSTWIVTVVTVSLVQTWATEGRILLDAGYYLRAMDFYAPIFGAGAGLIAVGRIVGSR
jgi:hypothetical protein